MEWLSWAAPGIVQEGMVLWHFPGGLESHGGLLEQGAVSYWPAVWDLLLWPTSLAVGQPAPSCPTSPHTIPGKSPHPFWEAPFLQKQRQTQGQGHCGGGGVQVLS